MALFGRTLFGVDACELGGRMHLDPVLASIKVFGRANTRSALAFGDSASGLLAVPHAVHLIAPARSCFPEWTGTFALGR